MKKSRVIEKIEKDVKENQFIDSLYKNGKIKEALKYERDKEDRELRESLQELKRTSGKDLLKQEMQRFKNNLKNNI